MAVNLRAYVLFVGFMLLCCATAVAQTPEEDPVAVVEVGAAVSRVLHGGESAFGPTLAVEVTPVESWLELEAGVTPLFSHGSTEWGTDLLFKKPWTLSPKVEFMIGVGPEWIHSKTANSGSLEAILDFMYWPKGKHKIGWYVEPDYEYSMARGHERSLGVSGGLLIAIWR